MPPEAPAIPTAASPTQRLRRLPGHSPSLRTARNTPSSTLWIDGGQLVQENVRGYTQEIQRFGLADIQSIQIRRTVSGLVYNLVLAGVMTLVLFIVWSVWTAEDKNLRLTNERLGILGAIAGPFAVVLLVNTLRGATCRTVLTTALGTQTLPSLSRMRPARRALDTIIAGVEAIQGAVPPDQAAQQVDRAQQAQRAPGGPPPPSAPGPAAPLPGYHY